MNGKLSRRACVPVAVAALTATLAGCTATGSSPAGGLATTQAQPLAVDIHGFKLSVRGAQGLSPGFVRLTIRSRGRADHGIGLVRLRRALTTPALLAAFEREDLNALEALGGVQSVPRDRPWEMTQRLGAGDYALLDYGENDDRVNLERGLFKRFRVAGPPRAHESKPATVGTLGLRDFAFDLRLPRAFSGRGVIAIANRGRALHEVSLVRIGRGHTQADVLRLIHQDVDAPPPWASVHELLGPLAPKRTAYVRLDLRPGRYVALCLVEEHGSGRLHADLGMVRTFDVGTARR